MKRTWNWIILGMILGMILLLSACTNNNNQRADADDIYAEQTKSIFVNPPKEINDHTDSLKNRSKIDPADIHEEGISSYLESILRDEDMTGIKVLVIGNSVVLAKKQIDTQKDNALDDHMTKAAAVIDDTFDGNNRVLTVTEPEAVNLINRIEDNMKKAAYKKAGDDISQLLHMIK